MMRYFEIQNIVPNNTKQNKSQMQGLRRILLPLFGL